MAQAKFKITNYHNNYQVWELDKKGRYNKVYEADNEKSAKAHIDTIKYFDNYEAKSNEDDFYC